MGADARWVCHTCETVCPRGGTPILKLGSVPKDLTVAKVDSLRSQFRNLMEVIELVTDNEERYISFMNDLMVWLSRHETHVIHIGSDLSTDMMDLDDYRDETVNGKVSSITRHEAEMACFDEWAETSIREIQSAIDQCNRGVKSTREAAEEIFNRYGMRES